MRLILSLVLFAVFNAGCVFAQENPALRKAVPKEASRPLPVAASRGMDEPGDSLPAVLLTSSSDEVAGASAVRYVRDSYSVTWLGLMYINSISSEVRFGADGSSIYLMDVVHNQNQTDLRDDKEEQTWVKGISVGADTYSLPSWQWIYADDTKNLYFFTGAYVEGDETMEVLPSWEYVLSADGMLTPKPLDDGRRIYSCISDADGKIYDYTVDTRWRELGPVYEPQIPAGVETRDYILTANQFLYMDRRDIFMAKVAFDGEDVYVSGLSMCSPNSVIKGKRSGNTLTFKSGQLCDQGYFGSCMYQLDAAFVDFENLTPYGYPTLKAARPEEWSLEIDDETGIISGATDLAILENMWGCPDDNYNSSLNALLFSPYLDCPKEPKPVENVGFRPDEDRLMVWFDYTIWSVNDEYIKPEELFYSFYFDDEPFTFTPEDFPGLPKSGTGLFVGYCDDVNIYGYTDPTSVTVRFPISDWNTMGIEMHHIHADGKMQSSKVVIENPESSVSDARIDGDTVRVEYYNLLGARVASPRRGEVVIVKTFTTDGCKVEKRVF